MDGRAVAAIAALDDDVRSALYQAVRRSDEPVTREAAAAEVGISRKLAAFHLDRLVAAGLLEAGIDERHARRVGRAPKVYRATSSAVSVCVPPRDPELLAGILAEAVSGQPRAAEAASRVARERGRSSGAAVRDRLRPGRLGAERALTIATGLLEDQGFEPARSADGVRLRNCPFHPVVDTAPELVCGLNREFLAGLLEGLHADGCLDAVLAPRPGACCVELRPR